MTINYKDKYNQQLQSIKDNYKAFDQPYNGKDNDDYVNGQGFCCNDGTPEAAQARAMARTRAASGNFKPNDDYEKMQFYYHPDHLGSSSYITNLDGEVAQHIEYVPFGEVFIEERNNTWNTPYLFNAKEFDEETGMYYYGARYYEPRLSLWMSVDKLSEENPNVSTYCYTDNNPIKYLDPDGNKKVVVTGGLDNHNKNPMNFILASKIQVNNYLSRRSNRESVNWLIFDLDYSKRQKEDFSNWAKKKGVAIKFVKTTSDVIRELNKSKKDNDKITELSIFAHGTASNVAFGYENTGVEYIYIKNPTNMNNYNIGQLSREDFANSARIDLYSCNSASLFGFGKKTFATTDAMIKAVDIGRSFAEQLSLQSGARVTGVVGRTDYSPVISGQLPTLGGMGGPNSPSVRD